MIDFLGPGWPRQLCIGFVRDLLSTVAQDWEGDVSFMHQASWSQVLGASTSNTRCLPTLVLTPACLVSDPSLDDLRVLYLSGQRTTWAKLPLLLAALSPMRDVDHAMTELRSQARARRRRLGLQRARFSSQRGPGLVPSFECMQILAGPPSEADAEETLTPGVVRVSLDSR